MKNPPSWAPNAVATKRGWEDPKTGELLVSIKGLEIKKPKAKPAPKKKAAAKKKAVEEVIEEQEVKPEEE